MFLDVTQCKLVETFRRLGVLQCLILRPEAYVQPSPRRENSQSHSCMMFKSHNP
jgi:hypothetical protein